MLRQPSRWWLCTTPTDMRRSYDGLSALVKEHLGQDPLSGHGFVFLNRRGTQLKCLYFDTDGYCIWCKRLERGQFAVSAGKQPGAVEMNATQFAALLEGLDLSIRRRRKRWTLGSALGAGSARMSA